MCKLFTKEDTVIVNSMDELAGVIEEHGHLLAVGVAWRLGGVSKGLFYRMVEEGRFRRFWVYRPGACFGACVLGVGQSSVRDALRGRPGVYLQPV